jgi:hypothetical protein
MKYITPKLEITPDPVNPGLKNYAMVWYGSQLETAINDLIAEAVRTLLPKALIENSDFQEKIANELKKAISSMQAEVLISIIKAAVREAVKEEKI